MSSNNNSSQNTTTIPSPNLLQNPHPPVNYYATHPATSSSSATTTSKSTTVVQIKDSNNGTTSNTLPILKHSTTTYLTVDTSLVTDDEIQPLFTINNEEQLLLLRSHQQQQPVLQPVFDNESVPPLPPPFPSTSLPSFDIISTTITTRPSPSIRKSRAPQPPLQPPPPPPPPQPQIQKISPIPPPKPSKKSSKQQQHKSSQSSTLTKSTKTLERSSSVDTNRFSSLLPSSSNNNIVGVTPRASQSEQNSPNSSSSHSANISGLVQPGFLVNRVINSGRSRGRSKEKLGSPSSGSSSGVGVRNVRKGDLVWFNTTASTPTTEQQQLDQSNAETSTTSTPPNLLLLTPGEVLEYHPKGNVLILKSSIPSDSQLYTIENNVQNVRRRIGELAVRPGAVGYPDMICMNDLSEPALIWNVKERYGAGEIYTYVGSILISVNPYKMFDIYGLPVVKKYEGKVLGALPPHLFAISSSAYTRMAKDASPQVIIISGESGSGKTEATKLIMGYLALVNKSPSNLITEQILEANPLLESFGNAKTGKNDNSSRFGKYLQVYFNTTSTSTTTSSSNSSNTKTILQQHHSSTTPIITGCRITEYLLEKSRIVTHNEQERNYHVFYELFRGLSKDQKEKYGLLSAEKYFYLNQGGNCTIPGKNDAEDFQALLSAMQILGFNNDEINNIFKILASVLHLGNVYFHRKNLKHGGEGVEIGSDVEVQWIGHLLEINPDGIRKALTSRVTEARGEKVYSPLTIDQSLDARDAISKVLYSSLFSWLVQRVNRIVYKGEENGGFCINILDIFGFEDFKENTFEQLLINYANESLQHIMNKHIFKLEQAEYIKEKIEWTLINYEDNLPVINLLTKKPVGILHLLDDESNFPKGTDASYLEKCHYNHALNEHYLRPRMNSNEFGVKHYAGQVMYNVEGFLEKNRDMVRMDVMKLLGGSRCGMIAKMFGGGGKSSNSAAVEPNVFVYHGVKSSPKKHSSTEVQSKQRFITMKPRAPTVAARFHDNLSQLLDSMSKCSPWFVRCIKLNSTKTPMKFDVRCVSNQLRYSGILETIRIRKLGYPIRYNFNKFAARYKCLVRNNYSISARDLTRMILTDYSTSEEFQLGSSKVFIREMLEQRLENARYELTHNAAVAIQSAVRGYLARKRFREVLRAVVKLQAFVRMRAERGKYLRARNGVIKLQALIRMKREKARYSALVKRMSRNKDLCVTYVNHLEIPAELAFMMSKLESSQLSDNVELLKVSKSREFRFDDNPPSTLEAYSFDKYVRVFFKSNFGMRREPIITPFLKESPEEALTVFKLILRYMNDPNLNGKREVLLMSYIVSKGMSQPLLRDEILVQVLNQTKNNENKLNCDRGWVLLACCLSSFQPSDCLYNYLLNYSFNEHSYSSLIQLKLLQMGRCRGAVRAYPPLGLEYRGIKCKSQMWVEIDGVDVRVESWSTVRDVAGDVAGELFGVGDGFSLEIENGNDSYKEIGSYSFVFDYLNEAVGKSYPFKFSLQELFGGGGSAQSVPIPRGKVVQPQPHQQQSNNNKSRSMESLLSSNNNNQPNKQHFRGLGLSSSRLNDRYHSFDNLDPKGQSSSQQQQQQQQSQQRKLSSDYFDLDEEIVDLSEEEEDLDDDDDDEEMREFDNESFVKETVNVNNNRRVGNPRFIKSISNSRGGSGGGMNVLRGGGGGSSANGGSGYGGGSRNYIENKHEQLYGMIKSSAMSDTSEAPSLASHVRRVRVPSQASDVDQFLDDLFSPVLENLDDLSEERSLITSIKGGTNNNNNDSSGSMSTSPQPENTTTFLQSAFAQNLQIQQQLIAQNQALQQLLQQTLINSDDGKVVTNSNPRASNGGMMMMGRPPPPPPPLPPSPIPGHRPFIDPYGRAKTVRIGKWRWPPKGEEGTDGEFAAFKARVEEARKLDCVSSTDGGDLLGTANNVNCWGEDDDDANYDEEEDFTLRNQSESSGKSTSSSSGSGPPGFKQRVARPFGGEVVGKLKLSNEMRMKLEQVTSVRLERKAPNPKIPGNMMMMGDSKPVKKLDLERRNVLEKQLGGGGGGSGGALRSAPVVAPPMPPPPPMMPSHHNNQQHNHNVNNESHQQAQYQHQHNNNHHHNSNNSQPHQNFKPPKTPTSDYSSFEHSNSFMSSFKMRSAPKFRLRKEVFMPGEDLSSIGSRYGEFLKAQVLRDLKVGSLRVLDGERRLFLEKSSSSGGGGGLGWKEVVEMGRSWEVYFWKLFRVQTSRDVSYLAVSNKGIKLVSVVSSNANRLNVVEFYSWSNITSITSPKPSVFALQTHSTATPSQNFFTPQADAIRKLCLVFYNSSVDSFKNKRGGNRDRDHQMVKRSGSAGGGAGGKDGDVLLVSNNRFIKQQQQNQQHHHQHHHNQSTSPTTSTSPHNQPMMMQQQHQHHHRFNPQPQHSPLPPPPPPPPPPPGQSTQQKSNSPSPTNMYYQQQTNHRSTSLSSPTGGGPNGPLHSPNHHNQPNSDPYKQTSALQTQQQQRHHSMDSTTLNQQQPQYQDDGKHSLLQFAMKYFRQDKFNLASALHGNNDTTDNRGGNSKNSPSSSAVSSWTWRDQIGLVKYSPKMIECSLLPMDEEMNRIAMECYISLLKYIGDFWGNAAMMRDGSSGNVGGGASGGGGKLPPLPPPPNDPRSNALADVEAVYTLLRNCHNSPVILRDEVYCQIMKQTTNNTSKSAQRSWRLFTILAAYFTCSEVLRPYLFKYLETNAYDKRRAFHGTALVCLQNLRKTFKYGGRRNVPSVEEITAITAGRNAKRQIFRLPGGTQRVVNIKATTVVQDVIDELCSMLNITDPPEAEEFSVYCIVEGDTFTMPLQKEEYILDVTTELQKNQQTFYLIFCRSVWYYPMRLDSSLYIEVVFNQIAPDYLEGLLLTMPGQCLTQNQYDISKIAALLHRAADLNSPPTLKETKYLLPKPALAARDMRPNQWVSLVNNYWNEEGMGQDGFSPSSAKAAVLEILASWDLFGSSFFSVKRLADPSPPEEYIMALNKNGVHFLDIITHETLNWWSYSEIISTRKVKNEDGILYLDMKTGNLMQTRITRFQTEHAHEISRLIRQYIHIQKYSKEGGGGSAGSGSGNSNQQQNGGTSSRGGSGSGGEMMMHQQQQPIHHGGMNGNNNQFE